MGLVRLEKAPNVARDLFSDYDYSQNHRSWKRKKTYWWKLSARFMHNNFPVIPIFHFLRWRPFPAWKSLSWQFSSNLCDFKDLDIKSYIFDHAESKCRPPEFTKSLFCIIWDKKIKYIMLVSIVRLQDLNVNPGNNCPCSASQHHTCNCIVWCKPDLSGVIYTTHNILICNHI